MSNLHWLASRVAHSDASEEKTVAQKKSRIFAFQRAYVAVGAADCELALCGNSDYLNKPLASLCSGGPSQIRPSVLPEAENLLAAATTVIL